MSDLPMFREDAIELARQIKTGYGDQIKSALDGTPFTVDIACAIACKETGPYLLTFIKKQGFEIALQRCVFDASGDADGTSRRAFPKDTAAFKAAYSKDFADMLIAEANLTRQIRGLAPKQWIYKGYGLFQYDLQHIRNDESFFREKKWYSFQECLDRLVLELKRKYAAKNDVWDAIQAYNGSGPNSVVYRSHVMQLVEFCKQATPS